MFFFSSTLDWNQSVKKWTNNFQSPAVDVVGIGTATGRIIIHNIRLDETLMSFTQDWGPITALAFRTGTGGGVCSGDRPVQNPLQTSVSRLLQTVRLLWRPAVLRATLHSGTWKSASCWLSRETCTTQPSRGQRLWIQSRCWSRMEPTTQSRWKTGSDNKKKHWWMFTVF